MNLDPGKLQSGFLVGVFGFFFAAYLLVTDARLSSIDDKIMFDVTRSMLATGSFSSSEPLSERDNYTEPWFYVVGKDGRAYGKYGLGESLAILPLFALGKATVPLLPQSYLDWFPADYIPFKAPEKISDVERIEDSVLPAFTSLLNPAATAAVCLLVLLVSYHLGGSLRASLATTGVFGFATAAFPYAKYSFQHPLVTALILASFYYLIVWRARGSTWRLVVSGACLGFAALTRYESVASLPILLAYAWWASASPSSVHDDSSSRGDEPRGLPDASPGLCPIRLSAPSSAYPLTPHPSSADISGLQESKLHRSVKGTRLLAANARLALAGAWQRMPRAFLAVIPFLLPVLLCELVVLWFNDLRFGSPWATGYFQEGFTADLAQSLSGLIFSPGRSIFLFSPPILLGLLCLPMLIRRHIPEGLTIASLIVLNFALYAKWSGWEGGWAWGARYPLPLLPFLTLPLVVALQARARWPKAFVAGLVIVSLPIQLLGVATNFNEFYIERTIIQGLDFWPTVFDWERSQIPGHADLLSRGVIDPWFVRLIKDGAPLGLSSLALIPLGVLVVSGFVVWRSLGAMARGKGELSPAPEAGGSLD